MDAFGPRMASDYTPEGRRRVPLDEGRGAMAIGDAGLGKTNGQHLDVPGGGDVKAPRVQPLGERPLLQWRAWRGLPTGKKSFVMVYNKNGLPTPRKLLPDHFGQTGIPDNCG